MSSELSKAEQTLAVGDLSKLSQQERIAYYSRVCESLGLNPLTRPFEYITLNGRLTLYARKDATDQLRKVHSVSITEPNIRFEDDWIVVTVAARLPDGRTDADIGVVSRKDMRGDFGNALMKAVTKAKRRVTLSICGLGFLDETEVETVPTVTQHSDRPRQLPPATDPEQFMKAIREAASMDATRSAFGAAFKAHDEGRITDEAYAECVRLKDAQKVKYTTPQTETPPAREPGEETAEDLDPTWQG